jgi:uncharacterized protein involved in high-affinity Fe2+ transport
MQGYCKGSFGPYITIHYFVYVDAYMQGYSKGSFIPSLTAHYYD